MYNFYEFHKEQCRCGLEYCITDEGSESSAVFEDLLSYFRIIFQTSAPLTMSPLSLRLSHCLLSAKHNYIEKMFPTSFRAYIKYLNNWAFIKPVHWNILINREGEIAYGSLRGKWVVKS